MSTSPSHPDDLSLSSLSFTITSGRVKDENQPGKCSNGLKPSLVNQLAKEDQDLDQDQDQDQDQEWRN